MDATCTADGNYDSVVYCSVCNGEVSREAKTIGKLGHNYSTEWTVDLGPTCTEKGSKSHHCSRCSDKADVTEIVANGHTEVIDPAVSATCTATGKTEGKHCSVCGETLVVQQTIPATGHSYDDQYDASCNICGAIRDAECAHINLTTLPTIPATCTATGLAEGKKCSGCGEILVAQEVIPAIGHDHEAVITAPTCTENGYTTYTCHCGDTYTGDEKAALGHTEVIDPAVSATCTATGKTEGKHCSVCGETLVVQQTIPATGHSYDDQYDASCNICGAIRDAECAHINLTTLPTIPATCTATGLAEGKKCSGCGEILVAQEVIPAIGHDHEAVVTAPTCTAKGYTTYTCHCGDTYAANETAALGHTEVTDAAVAATCTTSGKTAGKHCSVCNEVLVAQTIVPATGHDHNAVVTAPTCTTKGYTTYTCHCGDTYTANETAANGHTEVIDQAVSATCTTSGLTQGKHCSVCGETLVKQSVIPATGHSFSTAWEQNDTHHWHKSTCGHSSEISGKAEHNFGGDLFCDTCLFEKEEDKITFKTLQVSGTNVYGVFSNDVIDFSFLNEIDVSGNAVYYVSLDSYGMQTVITKKVPLNPGDNTFYILEQVGEDISIYTVTLRRRPMYTVTFNTAGGTTVASQRVEENSLARVPETSRVGYTFAGWNYDFSTPITQDTAITANWTANTYTITYDVNGGDALDSNTQTVTYDSNYTLSVPTRTCYTFAGWYNGNEKIENGPWAVSEDVTLTAKWQINQYRVEISNSSEHGTVAGGGQYDYQSTVTVSVNSVYRGYELLGWYDANGQLLSSAPSYSFVLGAENVTLTVKWKVSDAMVDYTFTSTNSTCTITGVTDKTKTSYIIPNDVTEINKRVFSGCTNITSITLPFVGATKDGTSNTHFGYIFGASSYSSNDYCIPASLKTVVITGGTSIDERAFYYCDSLTSITIPDSVKSIGNYAFYGCSSLTSITIPDSVTSIGDWAFSSCSSLTSITIPDSVTSIGEYAFRDCSSLTSITISDSVTSIGYGTFYDCTSLTSITIPDSVTSIGEYAFRDCSSLTSITIPDSVTSIGNYAFYGCSSLTSITIPDSVTSIGEYAFRDCSSLTSITIPDSVTSIGKSAFYGCSSLTSITLPFVGATKDGTSNTHFGYIFGTTSYSHNDDYVPGSLKTVVITGGTSIGDSAFYDCSRLTSITIPDSVTSIGEDAFEGCISLEDVYITDVEAWLKITFGNGYAHPNYYGTLHILDANGNEVTELVIPEYVTSIGDYTFRNCSSLTSITIPDSVTSIGEDAFSGCSSLTSITIPDSVTSIGDYTFRNCSSLTSITIPEYVTSIGYSAFEDCDSLTSITIPDSVTSIGYSAFEDCDSLTSITIPDSVTSIGSYAFRNCSNLTSITLPFVGATKDGTSNTHFGYIFGASSYSDNEYYVPATLKTVVITGGTSIRSSAFSGCRSLKSITIPDSVTSIGYDAFRGGRSLTSITIPDSVTSIGMSAFSSCSNLTSITIPNSVTSIGDYAFEGCSSLTSITVGNGVTSIDNSWFRNCCSLASITLPFVGASKDGTSNTHFGYVFGALSSDFNDDYVPATLKTVVITGGTSIASYAFKGCSNLTSITIPDSVTSIGDSAFNGCSSLESIILPFVIQRPFGSIFGTSSYAGGISTTQYHDTSITSSSNYYIPKSLKSVTITTVDNIPAMAFFNCSNLTSVTISDTVKSIGEGAFRSCKGLTSITIPDSVMSIELGAFTNCDNLTSITLPFVGATKDGNSDTYFGYIFGIPSGSSYSNHDIPATLQTVVITGGTSIGHDAFRDCSSLISITILGSVTSIGEYAFYDCRNLESVTFGKNTQLTSIDHCAFYNYNSSAIVYYGGTAEDWSKISIGSGNSSFTSATRYYYSETQPTTAGNYWHYVDGVPTKW